MITICDAPTEQQVLRVPVRDHRATDEFHRISPIEPIVCVHVRCLNFSDIINVKNKTQLTFTRNDIIFFGRTNNHLSVNKLFFAHLMIASHFTNLKQSICNYTSRLSTADYLDIVWSQFLCEITNHFLY